jgi:hypothetical protein
MSPTPTPTPRADEPVKITRSHADAEDALWLDLYQRINVFETAVVLAEFMRKHPQVQQSRPALSLRADETIRRAELRQQRIKRVANFFRYAIVMTVRTPYRWARRLINPSAELLIELVPDHLPNDVNYEQRVRTLMRDPRFAAAARQVLSASAQASHDASAEQQAASPAKQVKLA